MATYVNNLRLKEITTGDEDGTWGTSTNTNLELIADALGFNTQASFSSDADVTTTVADGAADPARALYFKVTSGTSLSTTRTLTIAPNTVSRVMFIENATTGSQAINISQGSGANVTIANGKVALVYLDGAGSGAAVVLASPQVAVTQLTDVTSSASELNLVDGSAADTVVNSKAVIYGSAGQIVANELDVDNIQIDANAVKSTNTNGNIQLFPNGTGFTELYGNTNAGTIRFNCESNSHGVTVQGPAHSAAATYTVKLPDTLGLTQASGIVTSDANGVVTFDNGKIEESTAVTSSSNAATINLRDGDNFTHTLTENVTYTFSNPAASGKVSAFSLKVTQDSSARTITWPGSVDWAAATAPTLTATSGGVDVFVFFTNDGGTTYYGFTAGQAMG
tara:strand:- start:49 stop:1230 length:1182 start_codon:yes stop_codon:yes gene_type:complete